MKKNKDNKSIENMHKKKHGFYAPYSIVSYGIILFSKQNQPDDNPLVLLYQRRDSFEYMDFLRGNWNSDKQLNILFSLMCHEERIRIRDYTFDELWNDLWISRDNRIYKEMHLKSKKKYNSIKHKIPNILNNTKTCSISPPWGFPKGKKNNYNEDSMKCAIREFEEETKIKLNSNVIIKSTFPLVENFKGSDDKLYTTYYYVAEIPSAVYPESYQTPGLIRKSTISEEAYKVDWLPLIECKEYINKKRFLILNKAKELL